MASLRYALRWLRPSPGRLVALLLIVEGLLWLSERFKWFPFNAHKGWTVLIAVATAGVFFLLMAVRLAAALLRRWPLQFTIRTLLILTVAVALPFSWLAAEIKRAKEQRALVDEIQKVGGSVSYEDENAPLFNAQPPQPRSLRALLGDEFFEQIVSVSYNGPKFTNSDLARLKGLKQLAFLYLDHATQVTDAGLENLKGLTQLQTLFCNDTPITDANLEQLAGLTQLHILFLNGTQVTDAGLETLKALTQLQGLSLRGTKVTNAGVRKLQQALPNCKIAY